MLAGCHHALPPEPVAYPPPAAHLCPPVPCTPVEEQAPDARAAQAWPLDPRPIDLPTALKLADAQNPQIAVARERIREALARQDRAEVLWLPDLQLGATWLRHDGQIQRATAEVLTISRSSLFVGGGPGLSLELSEALFAPLAARQLTNARRAGAVGVANELLLNVALAYIDLLQAYALQQIAEEAERNARHMLELTESHERAGKGTAADTARARTEAMVRQRQVVEVRGRIGALAARLAQLLRLPPDVQLRPVEPAIVPVALVPETLPLPELIAHALLNRPELAENRALIEAALVNWRAAKVAPLVPNLQLGYVAGGFGGGRNGFFGNFNGRGDATAAAIWQLENFGLGDLARIRARRSLYNQSVFRQHAVETEVAEQVVRAFRLAYTRAKELEFAQRGVQAARESYHLNEERVRRAPEQARPIELLQAIQALARTRQDYLDVVAEYNRAQFRLSTALGTPPPCALPGASTVPTSVPVAPRPTEKE